MGKVVAIGKVIRMGWLEWGKVVGIWNVEEVVEMGKVVGMGWVVASWE